MPKPQITSLTPEQKALIPVYREKWRKIALSMELIDQEKAKAAVEAAYLAIGYYQKPEIVFYESPKAAWKRTLKRGSRRKLLNQFFDLTQKFRLALLIQQKVKIGSQIDSDIFSCFRAISF